MRTDLFEHHPKNGTPSRAQALLYFPRVSDISIAAEAPLAIADMADLFGVTHRTLHFYEEKGLIAPQRMGAMRVYGADDIRRMEVICVCREIGISLVVIQELMESLAEATSQESADEMFQAALETRKRELTTDMSMIHRQIHQIRVLANGPGQPAAKMQEELPALADMERHCLLLMTEGYKGRELAARLEITSGELIDLEERIIRKLGVVNHYQAVAKALILGILPH